MITVGFDFGTHQTKICYETVEAGTRFYKVFPFKDVDGDEMLTSPSYVRLLADGTLRYGHDAVPNVTGSKAATYFKQVMFSWREPDSEREEAEVWSVLYLAFVIFNLDRQLNTTEYVVHMGMPTDADPEHYAFCRRQAMKVMASALLIARNAFRGDLEEYLGTSYSQLSTMAKKCMASIPADIRQARRKFRIFVFPEAYVALIPLINDRKLPTVGPNLFVDIGGGTVDISLFTNQTDDSIGKNRPCLYYYYSIPFGLNKIVGLDASRSHNVEVREGEITQQCVSRFNQELGRAVNEIMAVIKRKYAEQGKDNVMPFSNLCAQIFQERPICYSGGGSMFRKLRITIENCGGGVSYNFSQARGVAGLIDHSKLYVTDEMFHVLATAFALSHQTLLNTNDSEEPDAIKLAPVEKLITGIRLPKSSSHGSSATSSDAWGGRYGYGRYTDAGLFDYKRSGHSPNSSLIQDIANEQIKKLEKEREKQRKENELIIAKRRELEAAIRNHWSKVLAAKSRFEHGEPESALRVAELILQSPDFSPGRFEEARDWLNKAKDKGLVSIRLLYLFLKECKRLPNPESHIKRYRQIIQSCQAGRFGKFTFYEI